MRSYNYGQLNDLDDYLARDASYGIESAAILWGSGSTAAVVLLYS